MVASYIERENVNFHFKTIWNRHLPTFICGFSSINISLLFKNKDRFNWCFLCKVKEESIDHLLFECSMTVQNGNAFKKDFCFNWIMPNSIISAIESWRLVWNEDRSTRIWELIPIAIWESWKERNRKAFEGKKKNTRKLIENIKFWVVSLAKAHLFIHELTMDMAVVRWIEVLFQVSWFLPEDDIAA